MMSAHIIVSFPLLKSWWVFSFSRIGRQQPPYPRPSFAGVTSPPASHHLRTAATPSRSGGADLRTARPTGSERRRQIRARHPDPWQPPLDGETSLPCDGGTVTASICNSATPTTRRPDERRRHVLTDFRSVWIWTLIQQRSKLLQ